MSDLSDKDPTSPADSDSAPPPRTLLYLRKAVRYDITDVKATLYRKSIFHLGREAAIEIADISTRGAQIISKRSLSINAAYGLLLVFQDGKRFDIAGKVIHKKDSTNDCYGFRFDAYNDDLGDYLLSSESDFGFIKPGDS